VTKKEIAIVLGYTEYEICHTFERAVKTDHPLAQSIKRKSKNYNSNMAVNFTLEECLYAMQYNKIWNSAMKNYLVENFIDRPSDHKDRTNAIRYINQDAVIFLREYFHYKKRYICCNTCAYCVSQQPNMAGCRDRPFCNFYGKFIAKMGLNVYRSRCKTYERYYGYPRFWEPNLPTDLFGFLKVAQKRYRRRRKKPEYEDGDDYTV